MKKRTVFVIENAETPKIVKITLNSDEPGNTWNEYLTFDEAKRDLVCRIEETVNKWQYALQQAKSLTENCEVVFSIGTKVVVKPEYRDGLSHRETTGEVVKQTMNTTDGQKPFVDNLVQFGDGTTEPFGNWELEAV